MYPRLVKNVLVSALFVFGANRPALAAPRTDACLDAYESFQKLRDAGDLVGAKRALGVCGAGACPLAVQRECVDSLGALEPRIPTVVVVARDASKRDVADVTVFLDDKPWRTRLDGREVELNPGPHRFRFESEGRPPAVETFVVNEREKGRFLEVQLPPLAIRAATPAKHDAPVATASAPVPALVYVLGGASAVALGASIVFGVAGLSARAAANDCRPSCSGMQVDDVNKRFLAADISLGVAIVALAATTWIYLSRPTVAPQSASARQ